MPDLRWAMQSYEQITLNKNLKFKYIQEHFGIGMKRGVELPDATNTPTSLSLPLLSTIRLWKQVKDISQRTKRYNHVCLLLDERKVDESLRKLCLQVTQVLRNARVLP